MIPLVVLLFIAAPLILIRTRHADRLSSSRRKTIQAFLYMAMLLSAGLGMALDPREDALDARLAGGDRPAAALAAHL